MDLYQQVYPRVSICLSGDETFTAKSPTGGRSITVRNILVYDGYFLLSGNRRYTEHQIAYGFRNVNELPQMPARVQQVVNRQLALLKSPAVNQATNQLQQLMVEG